MICETGICVHVCTKIHMKLKTLSLGNPYDKVGVPDLL